MRNVDRFSVKEVSRISRNAKIIYQFGKYGAKGVTKINPALVFVDAVVSLGELFVAYANYKKIKEQNKQLEIEIKTLKKEFQNFKRGLELEDEKFRYELEQNEQYIEKVLRNNAQQYEILNRSYKYAKNYFLEIKDEFLKYKKEFPFSRETQELEKKYYEVLTLYTQTSLEVIGG